MTFKQLIGWVALLFLIGSVMTIAAASLELAHVLEALKIVGAIYGGISVLVVFILLIMGEL